MSTRLRLGDRPLGDIHRVFNSGPGKAVSLHVYGADIASLGTSIYRTYHATSLDQP